MGCASSAPTANAAAGEVGNGGEGQAEEWTLCGCGGNRRAKEGKVRTQAGGEKRRRTRENEAQKGEALRDGQDGQNGAERCDGTGMNGGAGGGTLKVRSTEGAAGRGEGAGRARSGLATRGRGGVGGRDARGRWAEHGGFRDARDEWGALDDGGVQGVGGGMVDVKEGRGAEGARGRASPTTHPPPRVLHRPPLQERTAPRPTQLAQSAASMQSPTRCRTPWPPRAIPLCRSASCPCRLLNAPRVMLTLAEARVCVAWHVCGTHSRVGVLAFEVGGSGGEGGGGTAVSGGGGRGRAAQGGVWRPMASPSSSPLTSTTSGRSPPAISGQSGTSLLALGEVGRLAASVARLGSQCTDTALHSLALRFSRSACHPGGTQHCSRCTGGRVAGNAQRAVVGGVAGRPQYSSERMITAVTPIPQSPPCPPCAVPTRLASQRGTQCLQAIDASYTAFHPPCPSLAPRLVPLSHPSLAAA
ncbi:unnamed protein product, partial [Closterium sp. NIES-64]